MKKILSLGLAALIAVGTAALMMGAAKDSVPSDSKAEFDFNSDDGGFVPIFADYPDQEGVEEFYEFQHSWGEVPVPGAGRGLFISGNNHSADLFMGYVKMLDGFAPARTYHFTVSFQLATDVESGLFGVGGSPGESVAVKCGITAARSAATLVDGYYRMNIDTGRQSQGGRDMVVVGDMSKLENNRPGEYEFKEFQAEFDVATDIRGEVYLTIATDSGFEAATSYYLDDIMISWKDAEQPAATRAQAAQMLFDTADRASADPKSCTFLDVTEEHPNAEAIAWVQSNGYMSGYGDGRFGLEDHMTMEQAMVMIYRFFGSPSSDLSVLDGITGSDQISSWAENAVAWTIASEITKPSGTISPLSCQKYSKQVCLYDLASIIYIAFIIQIVWAI